MSRSLGSALLAVAVSACAISPPAGTPGGEPTAPPPSTPSPEAEDSSRGASEPAPTPRSLPTPLPTIAASPTPDLGKMNLEAIGCPGGVVLHWTSSLHPEFHHYVALRSPEFEIQTPYPPIAPAVDWGDTYATDPFVTSAVDASILPSATIWYYRVMAYDVEGRVLGASPVRGARIGPVDLLGPVTLGAAEDGQAKLAWGPYRGRSACFTAYRVLYGTGGAASTLLATVSDPATSELVTGALAAGMTYTVRVEAVRVTTLGTFVTGRTETATITHP
jgi:hypothetical protein